MGRLITQDDLKHDLQTLGLEPGMTVLVHCAFKSLGKWVCGDAVALVLALQEVLGPTGTLVMPTHTAQISEPANWQNPPAPEAWWPRIREAMPPYLPEVTPTLHMGLLAETFRKQPDVLRSGHPQVSFAARGPQAAFLTQNHALQDSMGPDSPLGRLYDLGAQVLMIGVDYDVCTSFHLAEHGLLKPRPLKQEGAPLWINGARQWVPYRDLEYDSDDFAALGQAFERAHPEAVRQGPVAGAQVRLFSQVLAVDFAKGWLNGQR